MRNYMVNHTTSQLYTILTFTKNNAVIIPNIKGSSAMGGDGVYFEWSEWERILDVVESDI